MLTASNNAAQTLLAGQSMTFDVLNQTGCSERTMQAGNAIYLKVNGLYLVDFCANVTTDAAGVAQLQIEVNGAPLANTIMQTTIAAAGDISNVSATTAIGTRCACGFGNMAHSITVSNTGTGTVIVQPGSSLRIVRVG